MQYMYLVWKVIAYNGLVILRCRDVLVVNREKWCFYKRLRDNCVSMRVKPPQLGDWISTACDSTRQYMLCEKPTISSLHKGTCMYILNDVFYILYIKNCSSFLFSWVNLGFSPMVKVWYVVLLFSCFFPLNDYLPLTF